ncbi:MAG TPA: NTP transferase domain-containing protein [bacterium]|jgi:bifunctional UDP-N-acetylglucosamine pyrophosphorylase/glucosamine-1-phosphate N-acetyltransferase|nr:NTP transferase domain-containing protein [bacterium]HPY15555.1 NTP transferase domain-containing protein [bacterium]
MKTEAIVLAAGKGTRMKSNMPKVMHDVLSKPMIGWIMESLQPVAAYINVVTGHGRDQVEKYLSENYESIKFSFQQKQNGTGGAVRAAVPNIAGNASHIIICTGDTPLIKTETFRNAIEHFTKSGSDLTVVSTILEDAGHYGRIVRNSRNEVESIVEYLDADESERKIREINSGIYIVDKKFLVEAVFKIKNNNSKYEYYLTDIVKIANRMSRKVTAIVETDSFSLSGINDQEQLKEVEAEMLKRRQ